MTDRTPDNADLLKRINEIGAQNTAQLAKMDANAAKFDVLYDKLMVPQPGQDKSLLDRMAYVTVAVEGGQSTGKIILWVAGIGSAIAGAWVFLTHGGQP